MRPPPQNWDNLVLLVIVMLLAIAIVTLLISERTR